MVWTEQQLLEELRRELLRQGFDATGMTDEDLKAWLELADLEINLPATATQLPTA